MTCLRNTSSPLLLPQLKPFSSLPITFFSLDNLGNSYLGRRGGGRSARETIKVQAYSFFLLPHTVALNFFRKSLHIIGFRHFKMVFPSLHRLHCLGHSSRVRRRHRLWRRIRRWSCRLTGSGNSRRRRFVFGIATPEKNSINPLKIVAEFRTRCPHLATTSVAVLMAASSLALLPAWNRCSLDKFASLVLRESTAERRSRISC